MSESKNDSSVYELLTQLCVNTAQSYCHQNKTISVSVLASKMRSQSYEIILKKSSSSVPLLSQDPVLNLLSCCFIMQQTATNVIQYKQASDLKTAIGIVKRFTDEKENKDNFYDVLRLLVKLYSAIDKNVHSKLYERPFSFGILDKMLPKPKKEDFGSPNPYPFYPSYIFELPYKLRSNENNLQRKISYQDYSVTTFDSKLNNLDANSQCAEVKTLSSPMSLLSITTTSGSPYSNNNIFNCPRLTEPRDIQIPKMSSSEPKVSFISSSTETVPQRMEINESPNIWEIASQIDKDIPDDIWEHVSQLRHRNERQLLAASSREMALWRTTHSDVMRDLDIMSEKQFIRHIMYLLIGIETKSFPYNKDTKNFYMKKNLVIECVSQDHLNGYMATLLLVGTFYRRLYDFAFNLSIEDHFHNKGLVFEAARDVVRQYLLEFRLKATDIFEEYYNTLSEDLNCMPTLLQILHHVEPLQYEIETLASVYKLIEADSTPLPNGAELMSYLFKEISLVTHKRTAQTLFNSMYNICKVYFKFIERFIFEGELDDSFNEFFIKKDSQYVNCRTKRYWDKGFHITLSVAVPEFLRPLASFILLCGKSLRLLKLCNPTDPLVLLISSDHPSVRCCASFSELEREQQTLEVYRTRCRFVSGEPVTFDQILLKREAERKAFTEMASLKQAETMEKIVAERKRLAQLIIAEKQHSLRVLEAAMAEAKAAKNRSTQRAKHLANLEAAAERATEEVDSRLKEDERNKMLEYYSKLNMEVEKSKIHTEWKIKRLQLDQSRMQLLSTEERNLKREKLELEHQRNDVMAMSIQSDFISEEDGDSDEREEENNDVVVKDTNTEFNENRTKSQTSSVVFNAFCNAAKSIFGVGKNKDKRCDNYVELDSQGNIVSDKTTHETSSNVIGSKLDQQFDNLQFLEARVEAIKNKQKVMHHEFGATDSENNQIETPTILLSTVDEENNFETESTPSTEARRNKLKVLGTEFDIVKEKEKKTIAEPRTEAQKEALRNKLKVLGVEYNLPAENTQKREPANTAQEEALRNRDKVLASEYETRCSKSQDYRFQKENKSDMTKRSELRLNLKPYSEYNVNINTATSGAITPGDLFTGLDLETPTTAEMPMDLATASDVFTPRSEHSTNALAQTKQEKEYLSSKGFDFSLIVDDETAISTVISDGRTESDNSPSKSTDSNLRRIKTKTSVFNIIDGTYNLDNFDPFNVKNWEKYSKDYFNSRIEIDMTSSYTHPAVIMEEVKKRPYQNIFKPLLSNVRKEDKINCNNIATLTACLQRSVMLPLTYQLEVVNNSIVTYFLVDLDMYDHLRSLKDYFFLMDGEFSRSICHNLFAKLTQTLNPQELLNFSTLHNILDKALGSSISHVHKFSENLSFSISESPLSFQHSSPDVLQCLSLTYSVNWPLNIILSQEALSRYAKVFQFLIKMRRIFWVLSEDFQSLKLAVKLSREHSRKLLKSPQYISLQLYRHVMASLVRALDNYIVTTCILSSWTEFEKDLRKARTLDDLYECHVLYIKNVLFRCLLNNRSTPVMKLLNDIFTVILKFSRVLNAGDWHCIETASHFTHTNYLQLDELYHIFEKLTKYLHKVITKLMECGYQRHLVELLTMVNLNGYYNSDKTKALNSSVQTN
ncbi:gamma-tubulin complex component 6 [Leptidea sinapis]|uniref:gamma-tubulin complex component 6 n=1 Tax=Leptidea sinapis TaxID=189913 RepID=UPI00212C335A|nr:gamma-tubulin complex component 6 [Leptidea sinapis]